SSYKLKSKNFFIAGFYLEKRIIILYRVTQSALRSSLFALRSSLFALRSSLFALRRLSDLIVCC
ncbi:TPA: hypothetical protein MIR49_26685, partial [Klebsiella pneumoniae]|nr:hypothetical protein [Klebsiella pneumoniae]